MNLRSGCLAKLNFNCSTDYPSRRQQVINSLMAEVSWRLLSLQSVHLGIGLLQVIRQKKKLNYETHTFIATKYKSYTIMTMWVERQ